MKRLSFLVSAFCLLPACGRNSGADVKDFWGHGTVIAPMSGEEPSPAAAGYNFEGIVALSNCSGSLVRFENSTPTDKGIVLTNGHCVSLLDPGIVLVNQDVTASFELFGQDGSIKGRVESTKLLYATMTRTDIGIYELNESYEAITNRLGVRALTLSSQTPVADTAVEILSGFWHKGYSCRLESEVFKLREDRWTFENSLRFSRADCEPRGGTSGSPVLAAGTRTVIGINNTSNNSGERCTLDNPCEVDSSGQTTVNAGFAYGQQTHWIYSCRNSEGKIDLNLTGCQLPKPN